MSDLCHSEGVERYVEQGKAMLEDAARHRSDMRSKKFDTIAVHGLYGLEASLQNRGSIIEPLFLSVAQHFESSDHMEAALAYKMPSWTYGRIANPTQFYLEETLALLEGYGFAGEVSACATASGMAATFMATYPFLETDAQSHSGARPNIVVQAKCYGGTFMLFTERYSRERGVELRWVRDQHDLEAWRVQIDENTRFVFGELPSNPALALLDIEGLANLAHAFGIPLIIDSTIATPALTRPLLHGADIVVHSLTKAMTTSGFGVGGAVVARHGLPSRIDSDMLRENFALYVKLLPLRDFGPGLSAFNAMMTLNDLRTLRGKIDTMSATALKVAQYLDEHPAVEQVFYPGLPSSPEHALAHRYMHLVDSADAQGEPEKRFGYLMSFTIGRGAQAARDAFDHLSMISRATDLGRIKSVATIPMISTHQQQGDEGRDIAEIPANLIRLSVGGEHAADIVEDLAQALDDNR